MDKAASSVATPIAYPVRRPIPISPDQPLFSIIGDQACSRVPNLKQWDGVQVCLPLTDPRFNRAEPWQSQVSQLTVPLSTRDPAFESVHAGPSISAIAALVEPRWNPKCGDDSSASIQTD